MKYYLLPLLLSIAFTVSAQDLQEGLVAYYPFIGGSLDDFDSDNNGTSFTELETVCGVLDDAIAFDGQDELFLATNDVLDLFTTFDFSMSFYFKPVNENLGAQTLLHKMEDCSTENAFAITYRPSSNSLQVNFTETQSPGGSVSLSAILNEFHCWHHIAVVRAGREHRLYVDGQQVDERMTAARVDVANPLGAVTIGGSACVGVFNNYVGHFDELRIYDRILTDEEVELLFLKPDQIATGNRFGNVKDTTIFLGETVPIRLEQSCAQDFSWTPTAGVQNSGAAEPDITPDETTVYLLDLYDPLTDCTATDSILITVLDPSELDCEQLFLPAAFTPNGDQLNDTYGISNPFAVPELLSFEIYDRWGGRVFVSSEKEAQWDGSVDGKMVNPGVFLYRVAYVCNGEERLVTGSVTVLR